MRPNIQVGSHVKIKAKGMALTGIVKVIANRPYPNGEVDECNYWDLEYTIDNRFPGHGDYGRWKQNQDGGTVEIIWEEWESGGKSND